MNKKIVVAGTGYVGLSLAVLLALYNHHSPRYYFREGGGY